jgi:hypothetical protein
VVPLNVPSVVPAAPRVVRAVRAMVPEGVDAAVAHPTWIISPTAEPSGIPLVVVLETVPVTLSE